MPFLGGGGEQGLSSKNKEKETKKHKKQTQQKQIK